MCGMMSHLVICKFRKSMVIHDTECPYWDQVSLNNTNPVSMFQVFSNDKLEANYICALCHSLYQKVPTKRKVNASDLVASNAWNIDVLGFNDCAQTCMKKGGEEILFAARTLIWWKCHLDFSFDENLVSINSLANFTPWNDILPNKFSIIHLLSLSSCLTRFSIIRLLLSQFNLFKPIWSRMWNEKIIAVSMKKWQPRSWWNSAVLVFNARERAYGYLHIGSSMPGNPSKLHQSGKLPSLDTRPNENQPGECKSRGCKCVNLFGLPYEYLTPT